MENRKKHLPLLIRGRVRKKAERTLFKQLSFYSDLLGVPTKKILKRKDKKTFRKKLDAWFDTTDSIYSVDWKQLTLSQKKERVSVFLDRRFRTFSKTPKGKNAIVW